MSATVSLLGLAFSAGMATFFAPCAFPLVPGYLSYYLGTSADTVADGGTAPLGGTVSRRLGRLHPGLAAVARGVGVGLVVGTGMFLVYGVIAGIVMAVGARAVSDIAVMELVVGAAFVVVGAAMAAGWKPTGQLVRLPERRRSVGGFFAFGVLYAAAAAGCTAPLFVAVLLRAAAAGPGQGATVALAYAAGMAVVMVTVTVTVALTGTALVGRLSRHTGRIYRVAGALLALSGVTEIYYYRYGFPPWVPDFASLVPV
ncbi:cytochrome c biogenesis protein [Halosimplex carlsbadense 2-9-1]|uniref:Cytochrome c biogenesis protein n=1 Tax=Halosimplex carlsbadense 2-9-1 TaxID=797114 RepID=M0CR38_9EURY|nr:cytochrome c biogenesis protein CcdA [Halosimplex carlsbadense]ELZ25088.1 cytochrome c biogenesis protein [Halosimplex carlsbadense 2-9-1]